MLISGAGEIEPQNRIKILRRHESSVRLGLI
jgi:hypothetical protein